MPFEKVEFEFPDDKDESTDIELEGSSAETIDFNKPAKAKESDDFEFEIVDDTPPEDRGREPSEPPEEVTDDELKTYSQSVQQRIKHLSKGYHDERRAKEQAFRERQALEEMARKLVEENNRLKGDVGKSRTAIVEQAKRAVETEITQAKQEYREAYESGNSDAIIEAQEKLTKANLRKEKLANLKLPALQNKENGVKQPLTTQQQQARPPAPKPAADPKAQEWAKKNTWFGKDEEMTSFALGLHQKLVKSGVNPTSDTYYERLNARMRQVFPESFGGSTESRSSNVVAPATRSRAPKKVRLTKSQVAIAKRLGVPLDIYAKQVAEEMRKSSNG